MKTNAMQMFLTSRIGDGCCTVTANGASIVYSSVLKDYMTYKHKIASEVVSCSNVAVTDNSAGFNKHGIIYHFRTRVHKDLGSIAKMSRLDVINKLDHFGFMLYYFDDGSYHKAHDTMHIYCNSFNAEEVEGLKHKIFELFPVKECRNRIDRKADGRQYPYLYVPKATTESIVNYYKDFVISEPLLHCMLYKLGLTFTDYLKQ